VQYRAERGGELQSYNHTLSEEQLATVLPVLRQQPDSWGFIPGAPSSYGLDRFYLAQARNSSPVSLGTRTVADRAAQLIAYRTSEPLPVIESGPQRNPPPESMPSQVILAIDPQSLALLEVTVTPEGDGQRETLRPWRAELIEAGAASRAGLFALSPSGSQRPSGALMSPRMLEVVDGEAIGLAELLAESARPIYLPSYLPEPTSGVLLRGSGAGGVMLMREGPQSFMGLFLNTDGSSEATPPANVGPPQRVGDYYYYPIAWDTAEWQSLSVAALAFRDPQQIDAQIYLAHQYLSRAEREQLLRSIVASMRPLTAATADELGRGIYLR
jgi:hypothetical protein